MSEKWVIRILLIVRLGNEANMLATWVCFEKALRLLFLGFSSPSSWGKFDESFLLLLPVRNPLELPSRLHSFTSVPVWCKPHLKWPWVLAGCLDLSIWIRACADVTLGLNSVWSEYFSRDIYSRLFITMLNSSKLVCKAIGDQLRIINHFLNKYTIGPVTIEYRNLPALLC